VHAGEQPRRRESRAIRAIASANLFLIALYVVPITNRLVDHGFRALEDIGLAAPVGWGLQLWVVGSTLFATGLFAWAFLKSRRAPTTETTLGAIVLDGLFLVTWWVALLAICSYAFMLGRSGF